MFSAFRGKGGKPAEPPAQEAPVTRGMEVVEDDPDTAWGMWDSALAEQDSKFSSLQAEISSLASTVHIGTPMAPAEYDAPTQPIGLEVKTREQRMAEALAIVELFHHRIAHTIKTLWGYKECSVYINKLIMNGGDGMGHARVGFNQDAAEAMLALANLHDEIYGVLDGDGGGLGFADASVRAGLDGAR